MFGKPATSYYRGHSGAVIIHSPPTSDVSSSNLGPYAGKLVVAYQWWSAYRTESCINQLYVMVSSGNKTTHRNMTCTVLKVT